MNTVKTDKLHNGFKIAYAVDNNILLSEQTRRCFDSSSNEAELLELKRERERECVYENVC